GTFAAATNIVVGTNASLLQSPTSLAVGKLDADAKLDLAVSGSTGVRVLINTSAGPALNFNPQAALAFTTATPTLAIGNIHSSAVNDIAAATAGGVFVLQNDGTATFTTVQVSGPVGTTDLKIANLDGSNANGLVVLDGTKAKGLSVLTAATPR